MRRCRETAAPFEVRLGAVARVEPRVSEVVAPAGVADRGSWLAETFPWRYGAPGRDWATLEPTLHLWREDVLGAVRAIERDCAVFTHFIAINAIVAAALQRRETIVCQPGHASITELALEGETLRVVAHGERMRGDDVR